VIENLAKKDKLMNSIANIMPCFINAYKQDRSLADIRQHLSGYSMELNSNELFPLLEEIELLDVKVMKVFFQTIPAELMQQLYCFAKDNQISSSQKIRTFIVLQYCKNNSASVQDVYTRMEEMKIEEECDRYKLAKFAAKQDPENFTNEIRDFKIHNPQYMKRLAEISLYLNAGTFLDNLNEFEFDENRERESYFLRGLIRSTDLVRDLCLDDSFFIPSLSELSTEILEFLYVNFNFCKFTTERAQEKDEKIKLKRSSMDEYFEISEIKTISTEIKPNADQKSVFVSIFKNPCFGMGLSCWTFFQTMEERDANSFLAMILLLKQLPNAEEMIKKSEVLDFLKELDSFPDPASRFAAVAIVLSEITKGKPLIHQLNYLKNSSLKEDESKYHKICSLAMAACESLTPSSDWIFKQWDNPLIRRHLLRFLSELILSEKLRLDEKITILTSLNNNIKSQILMGTLIDFSVCISSGLTKGILQGESPTKVLKDHEMFFVNRLGAPYNLSVDEGLFSKLKFTREIAYYAQSLEKLSDLKEKDLMIPFFFKFLKYLANNFIMEYRKNTPEMKKIFQHLDTNRSVKNASSLAKEDEAAKSPICTGDFGRKSTSISEGKLLENRDTFDTLDIHLAIVLNSSSTVTSETDSSWEETSESESSDDLKAKAINLWEKETTFFVKDLIEIPPEDRKLNLSAELQEAFLQEHLDLSEFQAFYDYAIKKSNPHLPILEPKIFGQYSQQKKTLTYPSQGIHHKPLKTLADGDCLLHAIFGNFPSNSPSVILPNALQKREEIVKKIKEYMSGGKLGEHAKLKSFTSNNEVKEENMNISFLLDSLSKKKNWLGLEHADLIARVYKLNILVYNPIKNQYVELFYSETPEIMDHIISFNGINHWSKHEIVNVQQQQISLEQEKAAISHLFCKLLEEKDVHKQLSIIKQLKNFFHQTDDFYFDLSNWEKALGQKEQSKAERWNKYKEYKIVRSNDPYLLFRIGTIAGETCQRVTGDPAKNKCLLGYPSDGKNQLIYAQSTTKEPEACALLRFFYACDNKIRKDGTFKKLFPVLYLEPIYPAGKDPSLEKGIVSSAIQCARELRIPLVRHFKCQEKQESDLDYPYTLSTINGPAPFEYFDGLAGGVKQNNYIDCNRSSCFIFGWIYGSNIKLIFDPNKH
jgi:hypothetical protein